MIRAIVGVAVGFVTFIVGNILALALAFATMILCYRQGESGQELFLVVYILVLVVSVVASTGVTYSIARSMLATGTIFVLELAWFLAIVFRWGWDD